VPRADEGPEKSPILSQALACLTAHEPSSILPLDEKWRLFFLYSLSWSRHDDFSVRGTLAWRLAGAPFPAPPIENRGYIYGSSSIFDT
jgi:hypothetical protein